MKQETLDRIRTFVEGHRHNSLVSAQNAQLNGYKVIALQHQNEAEFAKLILRDLESEQGENNASK